jgi:hypothetical protein
MQRGGGRFASLRYNAGCEIVNRNRVLPGFAEK